MQPKISNHQPPEPAMQFKIGDIYYVLFKHKWLIGITTLLGMIFAGYYFVTIPAMYQSEAKLMIRFVKDTRAPNINGDEKGGGSGIQKVGGNDNILGSEAEILGSLDVATEVVGKIGVEKFLHRSGGTTNKELAALHLKRGLTVDVPRKGNIIRVVFQSSDPNLVQPVLREVIDVYLTQHNKIHGSLGPMEEVLNERADQLRVKLAQTEEDLRKRKTQSGLSSPDDRRINSEQLARLKQDYYTAEVLLAESQTLLEQFQAAQGGAAGGATNAAAGTNAVAAISDPGGFTNLNFETKSLVSTELAGEYRRLTNRLNDAWIREAQLLKDFKPIAPTVVAHREVIAELEGERKKMETEHPELLEAPASVPRGFEHAEQRNEGRPSELFRPSDMSRPADLQTAKAQVAGLQAKMRVLTAQLEKVKGEAQLMDEAETAITGLQRQKELAENQLRVLANNLEQHRQDMMFGDGKLSNINEVQSPSLFVKDSKVIKTKMITALVAGLLSGIALAFLIELVFDQSIRKPAELESKYRLPVFLSVPKFSHANGHAVNGKALKALPAPDPLEALEEEVPPNVSLVAANGQIAPWDEQHELHPYSEALRDRLVTFFELKNMTHKPKLIALTSCSAGAGVTTLAAGLAASLSETGEGNVLLVDMNLDSGAAHPFYKGKPACGIDDVLQHDKRTAALVQDKLYMVSGSNEAEDRAPRILPKRFSHLLPKLQASDYDYIIFDMPPVNPTSVTPRLAGFMDMVFLVVEGEKTNRDWIKQATGLLQQTKANVGAVYNKRRNYVPRWLQQEF